MDEFFIGRRQSRLYELRKVRAIGNFGSEPLTIWSGGNRPGALAFVFKAHSLAQTVKIGPFAAIWVGIWVGDHTKKDRFAMANPEYPWSQAVSEKSNFIECMYRARGKLD
jgi:hypothetical protein